MTGLIDSKGRSVLGVHKQDALSVSSEDKTQTTKEYSVQESKAAKRQFIKKYEMGTGKNRINVRIFKEPIPEPVIPES